MELGYEKLIAQLGEFGYMPNKADVYWETPFSNYGSTAYSYDAALTSADVKNRQFEICAEGEGGSYKADGEKISVKPLPDAPALLIPVIWWNQLKVSGYCR
jgi:hypothetical protein